jgi:hypothetical protein
MARSLRTLLEFFRLTLANCAPYAKSVRIQRADFAAVRSL